MKFYFRPMPALTLIVLIMFGILVGLGSWQYKRLQWKTDLLTDINAAANSSPLTSLADIQSAIEKKEPIDFRRFQMDVQIQNFPQPLRVYTIRENDYGWRLFSPVQQNGIYAFGAFETVSDVEVTLPMQKSQTTLAGYIRQARDEKPRTKSTPGKNRWFGFNPMPETHDWSNIASGADTRFYLDVAGQAKDASALPIRVPNIHNRHMGYMLTWWGLAFILLIYYLLMHKKEGRIGWS